MLSFCITVHVSQVASVVKNPRAKQEMQVWSWGWEDPLAKEMAAHSSILTWEIPWTEEPDSLQSWSCKESDSTEWLSMQHA